MLIFDTHAHYEDEAFDPDREEVLQHIQQNGIKRVVNVGSSVDTSVRTVELTEKYDFIYGAAGVHPEHAEELCAPDAYQKLTECLKNSKVVALGEIGLDYHYEDNPDRKIQQKVFEMQLELAAEMNKPVIIHSRDAAADTFDIMKEMQAENTGGIIHCFSYGKEMAREYLDMGLYLGIGGVVTFKNAKKLKEVVAYAPLEQLVLETDSPYLSPEPNRGKRNSSLNLPYVAEAIAQIKGCSAEEVIAVTEENAKKLLLRK